MSKTLTDGDVYTLIGHAELLRGRGETDMPAWCLDLAHRIAIGIDESLAARVAEIRVKCEQPPATQQPEPRDEVTDEQIAAMFERVTGYSLENGRAALNDADIIGFARELLEAARTGGEK
ncbi:hypothetical protein [Burkholderia vietnamiensis]|uniref:hypothetical protein n=1 Tax=Burkholderia vietnamiensis TaxID=60552 RepID=UPI0015940132|nr:hypothetical protein [Burkholderia vietnamiensis]